MITVPAQVATPTSTNTSSTVPTGDSLLVASKPKVSNQYSYQDVPYQSGEVKTEPVEVPTNPTAQGHFTAEPQSLPSIASLLSEGQTNGDTAKQQINQGSQESAATQDPQGVQPAASAPDHVNSQPTHLTLPTDSLGESAMVGAERLQKAISTPLMSQHAPHATEHSSEQPTRQNSIVTPPRALGGAHMAQMNSYQQAPQPVAQSVMAHQQSVPHMSQMPQHISPHTVHASPQAGMAHPVAVDFSHQQPMLQMQPQHQHQQAARSSAPYMMQQQPQPQQMGTSPPGPGGYMVSPQMSHQAYPGAHPHPHAVAPPGSMVNSGHPYMMQKQYWQKAQMHPMYPVMSATGMQPMTPVMQYYPAGASPYRAGHRALSMGQEIKRRTKTGCLTCRRRRIKCDEQHPMCKNCSKSERICLGYDPILMSFSADKNARLKQLQTKRRRFAQRQKYDKMRVASLVESTPTDAPHTWEQVVELFRFITPQLDELFETRQFSAIGQHVSQQLKQQSESKIVGELEVIRQLVAIVFSDRNFDGLNVLDFPGANLERLRTTNDYTLVRSLVEALTLSDGTLHAAHVADERIQGKVMLMKQVIFAKEIHTTSPVSAAEIIHSAVNAVNNPQQAWITISDLLTRGAQEIQATPQVGPLGTLVIASAGEHSAQQLLMQDLDPFSRTLLELSLDPP